MPSKTDMSVQRIEEEVRNRPKSLMFSRLADSYRKSGNVQQAISICLEGLRSHPDYITGRIILGRCYLEQDNFNEAIKEFTRVCKIDRRNQITIKMLADIFSKQGMEAKAGDLYNLLLKMDPESASLIHLTTVFKGSNKDSLFEILGIEEDIKPVSGAGVKPRAQKTDIEEAQELLKQAGAVSVSDQAEATLEIAPEESGVIDASLQEAAGIIDESSLDEILSADSGISEVSDLLTEAQIKPETVAEPEIIPEIEEKAEECPEKAEESQEAYAEQPKHADVSLEEDELPEGADITARMSSMFGEETGGKEEGVYEISVPEAGTVAKESDGDSVALDDIAVGKEMPEEPVDGKISEISSRMADMFGEGEVAEISAPTEILELEPADEILSEEDVDSAATVIIDKEELARMQALGEEAEEKDKEETAVSGTPDLEVLGISEEGAAAIAEITDEEPVTGMPTEIIDIEDKKTEIIEEPLEIESILESVDLEDPERSVSDFRESGELTDSVLTEATSIFDKETIRKLAEKESGTKAEDAALKVRGSGGSESVSGEDVISRLDEMFPSEMKKGGAEKPKPQVERVKKIADSEEESIPAEDRVHGEDVVSRIDEMFSSADSIPDDEIKEDETITDFYTETGDLALFNDTRAILEEVKQLSEAEDEVSAEQPSDEEISLADETVVSEISIDTIPDDELETVKEAGDFYDVSGDKVIEEAAALLDEMPEDADKIAEDDLLSGEDVVATIDKMFAEDALGVESLLEAIPDEEAAKETAEGDAFYNIAGEETKGEAPDESTAAPLEEESEEEAIVVDEETYFYQSESSKAQQPGEDIFAKDKDQPVKAESIPDHVLTPTLADIYFQQDQPYLAVQIYKRLLERDPDNEKIAMRIAEIEQIIRDTEAAIQKTESEMPEDRKAEGGKRMSKSHKKRHEDDGRPLKGIKIKRNIKERIKKARQELEMQE